MIGVLSGLLRVSVAVVDLEEGVKTYSRLGLVPTSEVKTSTRGFGLRWIELGTGGSTFLELLAPTDDSGPVARFLAVHGEGVYQVRLGADDLAGTLDELDSNGVRVIRDRHRPVEGRELGWVHPSATHGVLFELVKSTKGAE